MTTASKTPAIYGALASVMADCDHVSKRDRNTHSNYVFRGIDAVLNAVGPILRKHRVIVVPRINSTAYTLVQTATGKPSTACRVDVTYVFVAADDGSTLETRVAAEAWDSGDKAAPKAMSVAFRTALIQSLALPTDEPDPDSYTYDQVAPDPATVARNALDAATTAEAVRDAWRSLNIGHAPQAVQDAFTAKAAALDAAEAQEAAVAANDPAADAPVVEDPPEGADA